MQDPDIPHNVKRIAQSVHKKRVGLLIASLVGESFVIERMRRLGEDVVGFVLRFETDFVRMRRVDLSRGGVLKKSRI